MSKTLLLADDSSTIQRVIELTFAQEDIRVVAVGDGEQALKSIDREQPDIILADVGMPRMDGYSVSSHVKTSPDLQHIPVLLLTGAFEPIDEERARLAQCDGVLVKPFEPRALVTRVHELLNAPRAPKAPAAEASAVNGTSASDVADPSHVVPSWYKPERGGSSRPAEPSLDLNDLDSRLTAPPTASAVTEAPPDAASALESVAPAAPEPLILDLGSFTPVHSASTTPFGWNEPRGPEPLDLSPMPAAAAAAPAAPELAAAPVLDAAPAPALEPAASAPAPAHAASVVSGGKVSLATAFSALLEAEQAQPGSAAASSTGLDERSLEEAVRRVLLTDDRVRRMVLEATERIVKEEIERIQSAPEPNVERPETQ
jgi:CheY-like chemotaxis protein